MLFNDVRRVEGFRLQDRLDRRYEYHSGRVFLTKGVFNQARLGLRKVLKVKYDGQCKDDFRELA